MKYLKFTILLVCVSSHVFGMNIFQHVLQGNHGAVQGLIQQTPNLVYARDQNSGRTPVYSAITMGHHYIVELLLNNGANVNEQDNEGNTPLHVAAQRGNLQIVRLLLDRGADFFMENNEGWRPLQVAHQNVRNLLRAREQAIQGAIRQETLQGDLVNIIR